VSLPEVILEDLEHSDWCCATRWMTRPGGYLYSQRISDLNHRGLDIQSRRCQQHDHGVYEYRLVKHPVQLSLIA